MKKLTLKIKKRKLEAKKFRKASNVSYGVY